jgi:hypothetical protein
MKASADNCAGGPQENDGVGDPIDVEGFICAGDRWTKVSQR